MVKTSGAQQSKACVGLRSDRRWCCTGTPIMTSIEDLLGQVCVCGGGRRWCCIGTPIGTSIEDFLGQVCVWGGGRRWCCTGTPIGTSIEDLLGQVWLGEERKGGRGGKEESGEGRGERRRGM